MENNKYQEILYAIGKVLAEDFSSANILPSPEHKIKRCSEYGIKYTDLSLDDKLYIMRAMWRCLDD